MPRSRWLKDAPEVHAPDREECLPVHTEGSLPQFVNLHFGCLELVLDRRPRRFVSGRASVYRVLEGSSMS
jgi:hypothetical protein